MLGRRELLLGSASIVAVGAARSTFAIVPVILAALAAITALAVATGKAADAVEAAITKGKKLWDVVAAVPDQEAARREVSRTQEELLREIGIRREVVAGANASQTANATFVNSVRFFLVTRDSNDWSKVTPAMERAATALSSMARMFRENAVWFPAEAQDSLAELPRLYEQRGLMIHKLQVLSAESPPTSDEDVKAWDELVDQYDILRVASR